MRLPEDTGNLLRNPSLLNAWRAAMNDSESPCRIVACGLLCAGKSSLLNALSGRVGKAYFPVGAGRTTRACKNLADGGLHWVDTPGLDVSGEDDAEADEAIRTADILLFVHDPSTGELHEAEIDFLKRAARDVEIRHGLSRRLCVALTRKESHKKDLLRLEEAVGQQAAAEIGETPRIFAVSSTAYRDGARKSEPKLIEFSGLRALRKHLEEAASGVEAHRRERRANIAEDLERQIDREIADLERRREALTREIDGVESALREDFTAFLKQLRARAARLDG